MALNSKPELRHCMHVAISLHVALSSSSLVQRWHGFYAVCVGVVAWHCHMSHTLRSRPAVFSECRGQHLPSRPCSSVCNPKTGLDIHSKNHTSSTTSIPTNLPTYQPTYLHTYILALALEQLRRGFWRFKTNDLGTLTWFVALMFGSGHCRRPTYIHTPRQTDR